jgi:LysM repeat protein
VVASVPAFAQADNLLVNGGMEEGDFGPYIGQGRADLNIPAGWDLWLGQGSTDQYYNRGDKVYGYPHDGPDPNPLQGETAVNLHGGFVQYNLAMYQTVPVAAGANLRAEVASYLIACDTADGEPGACPSDPSSGAQTRIGIDPDGGSDPNAPGIVWSRWVTPHDRWGRQSVSATAAGTQVTVFLYATQARPLMNNYVYWDDARLTIGGEGGTAPTPTASLNTLGTAGSSEPSIATSTPIPPTPTLVPRPPVGAPFVIPQPENEDGSLIHTVRQGDTFAGIAYAYGLKPDELLERNPNLRSTRFLMIGQEIIIVPAPEATATPPESR